MSSWRSVYGVLAAVACGGGTGSVVHVEPLRVIEDLQVLPASRVVPTRDIADALTVSQREALVRADRAVARIVASDVFLRRLSGIEHMAPATGATPIAGGKVAAAYVTQLRRIEYRFGWSAPWSDTTASTYLRREGKDRRGVITLFGTTQSRLEREGIEVAACVINTLAHEWAHVVPADKASLESRFRDDDHAASALPLVSYTIGALAQCTFLEEHYLFDAFAAAASAPVRFDVWACVDEVGTTGFDPSTCAAGWGKQFVRRQVQAW